MPAHDDLLSVFISPLEQAGFSYFVTGSVASIFYGEPRLTHDVDLVLHLEKQDVKKLSALFPLSQFYCPPEEVIFVELNRKPYGSFNLIHPESGFKADVYLEGEDPLHVWALQNRRRVSVGAQLELYLAPPEYIIIRKLEYFREGASDKHLQDIKQMLPQIDESLDYEFLNAELMRRGLDSLWQTLKAKPNK